jgi:alginate O-acetyltransferase complex protein AlgI
VRPRDMQPLLRPTQPPRFDADSAARGFELFVLGLFKKAVLAQSCAHLADSGWGLSRPSLIEAWLAALGFTFELYFDFSGYTDMAIGAGALLGVKLPVNFDSPLKAKSIILFWRHWHMTLTAFITTYLYTPLLRLRRRPSFAWGMAMTLVAMTIAGLWHGAAWTFVVFGLLHGGALVVNNIWRKTKRRLPGALSWLLTFTFFVITLVVFHASNLHAAGGMLSSMLGIHGVTGFDRDLFLGGAPATLRSGIAVIAAVACFLVPNSNTIAAGFAPSRRRALAVGLIAVIAVVFMNSLVAKEFIYRDF